MYSELGTYVRERRLHLGLTQVQLAERVGGAYAQGDVSRLERGMIEVPRLARLIGLASALDVPVGNLLITSGWFNEEPAGVDSLSSDALDSSMLKTLLAEIEAELDSIGDLERQAESRAKRLRNMIRDLKVASGLSVTLTAAD